MTPAQVAPTSRYGPGDIIGGKFEVSRVLGEGGFGIVYLVYSREAKAALALKTFRESCLTDPEVREMFRREAQLWVGLESHPNIVRAHFVEEIGGRLYVAVEHVPSNERGLNTLEGYLSRQPPDLPRTLRWAIQVCRGMEHAAGRGLRCHRDLKPSNILITPGGTAKVSDFGLAGASLGVKGVVFGTPSHMPPEQFSDGGACDARSDVYSFGVVLYQMAARRLPFAPPPIDRCDEDLGRTWDRWRRLHAEEIPPPPETPIDGTILGCLEKDPARRFPGFSELRAELETHLRGLTGESLPAPEPEEQSREELGNKGVSLIALGRHQEALDCFERMPGRDPQDTQTRLNRAEALRGLGRLDEVLAECDECLRLDPRNAKGWSKKGSVLCSLGRQQEGLACLERAVGLDPADPVPWYNRGMAFYETGRFEEAIEAFGRALRVDPRDAPALCLMGICLASLGRNDDALPALRHATELDPRDASAWTWLGTALNNLGRPQEALPCFSRALEIEPKNWEALNNQATSYGRMGLNGKALQSFEKSLALKPDNPNAHFGRALCLAELGRKTEAAEALKAFLKLAPPDRPDLLQAADELLAEWKS